MKLEELEKNNQRINDKLLSPLEQAELKKFCKIEETLHISILRLASTASTIEFL
jgi:hypothetical protein